MGLSYHLIDILTNIRSIELILVYHLKKMVVHMLAPATIFLMTGTEHMDPSPTLQFLRSWNPELKRVKETKTLESVSDSE